MKEDFAAALGGKVAGEVTEVSTGHFMWTCHDCKASGGETDYMTAGLALYIHRQREHVGVEDEDR